MSATADHTPTGQMAELIQLDARGKSLAVDAQIVGAVGSYEHAGTFDRAVLWTDCMATYR